MFRFSVNVDGNPCAYFHTLKASEKCANKIRNLWPSRNVTISDYKSGERYAFDSQLGEFTLE
jgi:hypothetical protein